MLKEIWKDIEGYENRFQISNTGKVKQLSEVIVSKQSGEQYIIPDTMLRPHINDGYLYINFDNKSFMLHRLVAQAFIPNLENKPIVSFIDDNKLNVDSSNLEWLTHSEMIHKQHRTNKPPRYRGKPIKCIETGQTFDNMKDASIQTGVGYESISNSAYMNKPVKGYTFAFI